MNTDAYFKAIDEGDLPRLEELLRDEPGLLTARCVPPYAPERQLECTGLHAAIYAGRIRTARALIDAGVDLEARTTEGRTALHDSIEFGCPQITELLLEHGAEVDICTAAILGRLEQLREWLDRDPDLANDRSTNLSPLGWAAFGNQLETARELIDRGARMDDGELLCAASVGHVEVGCLLIDRGVDPNAHGPKAGGTALHAAAAMKYTVDSRAFISMLLEAGANAAERTADGRTALDIAEKNARLQEDRLAERPDAPRKQFAAVAALLRELNA